MYHFWYDILVYAKYTSVGEPSTMRHRILQMAPIPQRVCAYSNTVFRIESPRLPRRTSPTPHIPTMNIPAQLIDIVPHKPNYWT